MCNEQYVHSTTLNIQKSGSLCETLTTWQHHINSYTYVHAVPGNWLYTCCSHATTNHPPSYSLPHLYMHNHYCISQLLAEVSIKECDADYAFAEEDDIMSKNCYKGLCPCMHLHTKYHHTQHTQHHTPHSTTHHTHHTPHPTTHKALYIQRTLSAHTYVRTLLN